MPRRNARRVGDFLMPTTSTSAFNFRIPCSPCMSLSRAGRERCRPAPPSPEHDHTLHTRQCLWSRATVADDLSMEDAWL